MSNNPEDITPDRLSQQLCEASSMGDLERVKDVFEQWKSKGYRSENPNYPLEELQSALYLAASSKHASIVSYLLSQGLYVGKEGLMVAVKAKSTDVFQAYLDNGWDINQNFGLAGGPALTFYTVLHDQHLLSWFLAHGASPNANNEIHRTSMDAAAWFTNTHVLEQLLQHGGMINQTNALHMAVRSSKPSALRRQVVEYLLKAGVNINAIEFEGTERVSSSYGTALHNAAGMGREDMVRLLLENGADIKVRDMSGHTASEVAEKEGYPQLIPMLSAAQRV